MDFELKDPSRRKNALANMMTHFGLQMVDIHESEVDNNSAKNETVCLTRDGLISSIERKLGEGEKKYQPTVSSNKYYYPEQQTNIMAPQPIPYPVPQPQPTSDNFDISDYMGLPKQQSEPQPSNLDEALKPIVVRLEGICKILGIIYQEIKNNQSQQVAKPVEILQEPSSDSKKTKQPKSSKKKDKDQPKEEYQSLDDVSDEDVEEFDKDGGEAEYV